MKKIGILNTELARVVAGMGHTDRLIVCDSGLPIPHGSEVVDLALTANIPRFIDTVGVVLEELQVERAVVAEEMRDANGPVYDALCDILNGLALEHVPHERFKALTDMPGNTTFVRTGEATPYANVMLISGVTFTQ